VTDDEFTAFFDRDFDRLVGVLCKSGYDREIARDAAAEAMTEQLRQWSEVTAPKAWVRTVGSRIAFRLVAKGPRSVKAALTGCWEHWTPRWLPVAVADVPPTRPAVNPS
jgi:hypothetical protein